jgi:hypothetical protein
MSLGVDLGGPALFSQIGKFGLSILCMSEPDLSARSSRTWRPARIDSPPKRHVASRRLQRKQAPADA